jgi:hypothetical protein
MIGGVEFIILHLFFKKYILPCLDTGNRISSIQIWDTTFQGWILDSMVLVSTWILTKISSFEPCHKEMANC